jgi:hypothetical protein
VKRGAELSDCGLYRYRLWRTWGSGERMAWIMLNPSTADALDDDPTIRRCMGFARREGYDGIEVINLYALRSTKPRHLFDHPDPEGPDNWSQWQLVLDDVTMVVAAWGAHATDRRLPGSQAFEAWSIRDWYCLGKTAYGLPRHPLYVPAGAAFVPLVASAVTA